MVMSLQVMVGTRSRASVVACPHDAKRACPDARERIPTEPTAHFERNEILPSQIWEGYK